MRFNTNPFHLTPEDRIRHWRNFREQLPRLSDENALKAVVDYWSHFPLVSYYVDWDAPETWPTPWEIIHSGEICQSGKAICIYQTLILADPQWQARCCLLLITDSQWGSYLTVLVDDKLLLNYSEGEVVAHEEAATARPVERYEYRAGTGYLRQI